jgi:ferredoxin
MKVDVDQMKCGTVGICVKICPEVFRFQEGSKKATVLLDPIPTAYHDQCRRAARECPNNAIIVKV